MSFISDKFSPSFLDSNLTECSFDRLNANLKEFFFGSGCNHYCSGSLHETIFNPEFILPHQS
jgi:hypothetical protein